MKMHHNQSFLLALIILLTSIGYAHSAPTLLDFSSGIYSSQTSTDIINRYDQDGFTVKTIDPSHKFSETFGTYGPTLAWYEYETVIKIDYGGDSFDLLSFDLVVPTYAGLIVESSRGDIVTVGSISGTLHFSGPVWTDIEYFTVGTLANFDILKELDNMILNTFSEDILGDCNEDLDVDGADLADFVSFLAGDESVSGCEWDLDHDSDVDSNDMEQFAINYGSVHMGPN